GTVHEIDTDTVGPVIVREQPGATHDIFVHYFPDADSSEWPDAEPGAFGGNGVEVESTYNYLFLDAGGEVFDGDIDIRAFDPSPSATRINIIALTEIRQNGNIDIDTNGFVTITEDTQDLRAGQIRSTDDHVTLFAPRSIVDAPSGSTIPPFPGDGGADVIGVNITMTAGTDDFSGTIGANNNFLEIDSSVASSIRYAFGVLRAFAPQVIRITEIVGDMNVHTVHSTAPNDVSLVSLDGSIVDGRNDLAGDDDPDVLGNSIDIDANSITIAANIGNPNGTNDLEIDSSRGSTHDVGLEADDSIYLTETDGTLTLVLAQAIRGDIRITVREHEDDPVILDDDLHLIRDGTVWFVENAERTVPNGTVVAWVGFVLLRVGDDVDLHQHSQVMAGEGIDIYGDAAAAALLPADRDEGYGTTMVLRGRIIAGCINPSNIMCSADHTPTSQLSPLYLTQIWGYDDIDHIDFGDPTGQPLVGNEKTTFGLPGSGIDTSPGFVFLGSKTIARGGDTVPAGGDLAHDPSLDDGEDVFTVWYLQSTDVLAAPAQLDASNGFNPPAAGHSLTLDGQADTDYYRIYTTGSRFSARNYVINVLDTGREDDGVDELDIYGRDNPDPGVTGYVPGTTTRNPNDDIFLLRAVKCIDTDGSYGLDPDDPSDGVPTDCDSPTETADHPAFVALLHGDVNGYRTRQAGDESSDLVQRIHYDAALNGRLAVYGFRGNDHFYVDDNSATTTLDGGEGFDYFQVGQIFGTKRDQSPVANADQLATQDVYDPDAGGNLLPHDTFPVLIATTRGWLSPGTHAPLVATGGTGNDEFVVYSNQAELRLEGHDDNDLFIVRAFALAAVCDTNADGTPGCQFSDINLEADPDTGLYPVDPDHNGTCTAAENPNYDGEGWNAATGRLDNNGDHVCNKADAHTTFDDEGRLWEDDVIPLDADGVARPIIGLGFSTARPLDIRAGGGEDEVSYNVNAPVSVDGGTGFDKLVVLGTEFADDIVISAAGILGAGLNVRYAAVEVVEVDGLEGDDEFFVLSTVFGTAYRVIGGLGSDTINITSDVVEDIVTRELEGVSGSIDHRVVSIGPNGDVLYDGLPVDGLDYNLATPDSGQVIIGDEGDEGTSVRERSPGESSTIPQIDSYSVKLAAQPTHNVYVTVSAARSTEVEFNDKFSNPEPLVGGVPANSLSDGPGDSIWVCTGAAPAGDGTPSADCDELHEFQRHKIVNGQLVDENNRALVLTFTPSDWDEKQWVYVFAVDDARSEGDVVTVVQHSTISEDPDFDAVDVRNVEVSLRDNDTPGVYVTEVEEGSDDEDGRTLVIEGFDFGGTYTGRLDDLLVQLQKDPGPGVMIRVKITMDADTQRQISLSSTDPRFVKHVISSSTFYTIDFLTTNWDDPVRIVIEARPDGDSEDPFTAIIRFDRDNDATIDPGNTYVFPNIRSGRGVIAAAVIDDETPDVVAIETGNDTVVQLCGDDLCTIPGDTDEYVIRLTKRPEVLGDNDHSETPVPVDVQILVDGLSDVISIGGVATPVSGYQLVGGYVASQRFNGFLTVNGTAITRANGSDLGSFFDEGFFDGGLIRVTVGGAPYDAKVVDVAEKQLTVEWLAT
ncbi:MAG TPA: hypothetical protein VGK49_13445, partial [Ilumatobacteraceae bacterium]